MNKRKSNSKVEIPLGSSHGLTSGAPDKTNDAIWELYFYSKGILDKIFIKKF